MFVLILILILWIAALRGRVNHPGLEKLRGWSYAHRGLHREGIPENSMAAFREALEHGFGIEFDLHLLRDGNLAVMHDSKLKRTTGQDGRMEDLRTEDLGNYRLQGTDETIPEFMDVLNLFQGKAPLIIELKPEGSNYAALCQTACDMLESYKGTYCIESFDPRCVRWLRVHRPDIIRGQLAENFFRTHSPLSFILKFLMTNLLLNFLTYPDFIAYHYPTRTTTPSVWLCRRLWRVQGVSWTLKTREAYDTAVSEGWIPIFELPAGPAQIVSADSHPSK